MITTSHASPPPATAAHARLQRWFWACCIAGGALAVFIGFAFDPNGGLQVPALPTAIAHARAQAPLARQVFLLANAAAMYLYPLSYVGLGLLAMRRSPWLATLGIGFGLAGTMLWGVFLAQMVVGADMARIGYAADFQALYDGFSAEPLVVGLFLAWIAGHLTGTLLLGIALIRSGAVPPWAAAAILLGVPLQMAAYPSGLGVLQDVAAGLAVVASVPAAVATLRGGWPAGPSLANP